MENKRTYTNSKNNIRSNNISNSRTYGNDRPIRPSNHGKYNMNFIDWNNEWERVSEVEIKIRNEEEIEDKEEEQRVRQHMDSVLKKLGVDLNSFLLVKNPDCSKECYICLRYFTRNKRVRMLPCKHMFCEECLKPWLKTNYICPTCKTKLKNEDEEEIEDNYY